MTHSPFDLLSIKYSVNYKCKPSVYTHTRPIFSFVQSIVNRNDGTYSSKTITIKIIHADARKRVYRSQREAGRCGLAVCYKYKSYGLVIFVIKDRQRSIFKIR